MDKQFVTLDEIKQQPEMWKSTLDIVEKNGEKIEKFFKEIEDKYEEVEVIFTGAGTSDYVGNVIQPHLKGMNSKRYTFESIPTTDIVSNPYIFLENKPTILVSFARSGNSPESVGTVKLAEKCIDDLYQVVITCAEEGKLAVNAKNDENTLLILLDKRTNDKGFAMTSSFSSMALAALLIFDRAEHEAKRNYVDKMIKLGEEVKTRTDEIQKLVDNEFDRIVYLGSGSLGKLTREAQLKILELTAGAITTCFDSSMGFRHGPKSFVNENTLVIDFVSNNTYTRQYDLDIVNEIKADGIAREVYPVYVSKEDLNLGGFRFEDGLDLPDVYLAIVFVMIAQFISLKTAIKVKNDVDNPSASGTVNRVVKGVTIHEYNK